MALEIKPGQVLFHAGGAALARYGVLARRLVPGTGVRESFTRAGPAWQRTRSGRLVQAATDGVRADWLPDLGVYGIPLEPSDTNFLLNTATEGSVGTLPTSMFVGAPNTAVVSQEITDLDGNGFVVKHTRNAASGAETNVGFKNHGGTVLANTTYTGSMWLYLPSAANISSIRASLAGTAMAVAAEGPVADLSKVGQWQRLTATGTTDADAGTLSVVLRIAATGSVDGIIVYTDDWQVEEGPFATSWVKTVGSTVTRATDDCSFDLRAALAQYRALTIYARVRRAFLGDGGISFPRIFSLGGTADVYWVTNGVRNQGGTSVLPSASSVVLGGEAVGDDIEVALALPTSGNARLTARRNGATTNGANLTVGSAPAFSDTLLRFNQDSLPRRGAMHLIDAKLIAGALVGTDAEILDACARAAA